MLLLGLVTLAVVGIGVALLMWRFGVKPNTVPFEMSKDLLQVGIVSAAGAILSLLSYDYQQGRRRRENRDDLLKVTLARAAVSYNDVKRARRLLRARVATGQVIEAAHYDTQFATINDAQLEFEMLIRDVETSAGAFTDAAALIKELQNLKEYLYKLVGEYSSQRGNFAGNPEQLKVEALPVMQGFVALIKEGQPYSFDRVQKSFGSFQRIIRQDLLA
jgi:hypothetical protein